LSALSVSHDIKKPAVIVSVGTAVTIDYVSYDQKNNQYSFEGGVILPGLHLTKNALANNTADLKSSEGIVQMPPINTASAIQTGFVLSVIGNIKFLFDQASSESQDVAIILSGGDAELIEQHMDKSLKKYVSIKKDLVLEGLFIFASH
jgi:type III pantothenate kinase